MLPDPLDSRLNPTPVRATQVSAPGVLQYQPRPAEDQVGAGGGFRLFRALGVTVFLHWSWFLVAIWMIESDKGIYTSIVWSIAQCLVLFGIVLLHEFGHALACRSVGGQANRILLWPLGGVAFVSPPPRAGAVLWSIAAGPLVNVVLVPITYFLWQANGGHRPNFYGINDLQMFTYVIFEINATLLIFNMLPIYPLDGGQILQSLLWFVIGRARSLLVAASIGILGAVGGIVFLFAFRGGNMWLTIMAIFAITMAWSGVKTARKMLAYERAVALHRAMNAGVQ
ncbi:MAG TPA: M50 family metallopeptidase [Tepidisphaeraceae bacterium]|nr:M50 family metallopeptidase [Tepidisphaeraceae bacterium]